MSPTPKHDKKIVELTFASVSPHYIHKIKKEQNESWAP